MHTQLHAAFRSEKHRLRLVDDIRAASTTRFFHGLRAFEGDLLLRLQLQLPVLPEVRSAQLHARAETRTLVLRLTASDGTAVVWKIYARNNRPKRAVEVAASASTNASTIVSSTSTLACMPCVALNAQNHEIEVRCLKLFAELVRAGVCPHFVLPVGSAVLPARELQGVLPTGFTQNEHEEFVCILAESCDCSLHRLLRQEALSHYALSGLILQVVLTLCVLQSLLPSFRHNDLHVANVLVQRLDREALPTRAMVKYSLHGQSFFLDVRACPFRALLWDMHFASVSKEDAGQLPLLVPEPGARFHLLDTRATTPEARFKPRSCVNQYYDLHRFLDTLELVLLQRAKARTRVTPELRAFLDDIVPLEAKCLSVGRDPCAMRLWELQITTPRDVLQHALFTPFRRSPVQYDLLREYHLPG